MKTSNSSPLDTSVEGVHGALLKYRQINGRNPQAIIDLEGVETTLVLPENSSIEGAFRESGLDYTKMALTGDSVPGKEELGKLFASYVDNRTAGYDRAYGWPAIDGQLGSDQAVNMAHLIITRPATEEEKAAGDHVVGDRVVIAGMRFAVYDPDPKKYPAISNESIKDMLLQASHNGEMPKGAYLSGVFINPELLGKAGMDNGVLRRSTSLIYDKFFEVAKGLGLDFIYAGVVEHNVPALGLASHEKGLTVAAFPDHVSELTNRGKVQEGQEIISLAQLPMVLVMSPDALPGISDAPGVRILNGEGRKAVETLKDWKKDATDRNPSKQTGVAGLTQATWAGRSREMSKGDSGLPAH